MKYMYYGEDNDAQQPDIGQWPAGPSKPFPGTVTVQQPVVRKSLYCRQWSLSKLLLTDCETLHIVIFSLYGLFGFADKDKNK